MKKKYLKNILSGIKYNWKPLIQFELLWKVALGIITLPFLSIGYMGFIHKMYRVSLTPVTIITLLILAVFLSIVIVFCTSTVIVIIDKSYHEEKIGLLEAIKVAIRRNRKILEKDKKVILYVLFLLFLLGIGAIFVTIATMKIKSPLYFLLGILIYGLFALISTNNFYFLHYMILEEKNFKNSRKYSKKLIKDNKTNLFEILLICVLSFLLGMEFILAIQRLVETVMVGISWILFSILLYLFVTISSISFFAIISNLFYKYKIEKYEDIRVLKTKKILKKEKPNKVIISVMAMMLGLSFVASGTSLHKLIPKKVKAKEEVIMEQKKIEVTAHRGASKEYPENTMSAFIGAKNLGADWIELDVHQTKDRKLILSHEDNLVRIIGVNEVAINLTYEEIKDMDAGSFFSSEFSYERIPLLEDVIKFAKQNKIKLNIELKTVGTEIDFEKDTIDLIKKYKLEDQCIITSTTYSTIEKVKEEDKDIKTGYVVEYLPENILELKNIDVYSIEQKNITEELVEEIHNRGKELLVWTVDREEDINRMIDLGVDNIITDDVTLTKELIEEKEES